MVASFRSSSIDAALRVGQVVLVLAVCAVGYRAVTRPAIPAATPPETVTASVASATVAESRPLEWYSVTWQRDLRQPPIPPNVETTEADRQALPPSLPRLLGTFIEADQCWAHFVRPDGRTRVCRVEATIGEFRVVAVETGRAQLAYGEERYWVEVPRPDTLGVRP